MTQTLQRRAHAKINLALSVGPPTGERGYHPIASWFACIALHDSIELERVDDDHPSVHEIEWAPDAPAPSPIDWPVERDLAVRAHRLLEAHAGRALPVRLRVRKRIPVGAGMGGGSSDAAAALAGVNQLFGLGLPPGELARLGTALGSDIPFFLDEADPPRPALVTGFGEAVERRSTVRAPLLLILPPCGCPTGGVYQAYDRRGPASLDAPAVRALVDEAERSGRVPAESLFNDLTRAACEVEPRLAEALAAVRAVPGVAAHVTGSGSAIFALPVGDAPADLGLAAARIRESAPLLRVLVTRTV